MKPANFIESTLNTPSLMPLSIIFRILASYWSRNSNTSKSVFLLTICSDSEIKIEAAGFAAKIITWATIIFRNVVVVSNCCSVFPSSHPRVNGLFFLLIKQQFLLYYQYSYKDLFL